MKKAIEVSIMGQKLQVKSENSDTYISKVAEFVDQKMKEVQQSTKSVSSLNVAILAAMNITDEYLRIRDRKEQKNKALEQKVQDLVELIDVQL
ncbi:MAG: cell division protein ZapA [Deltaproteobacteria bacterium]|nr:cell division protein ZapA [Deltaproteobacteria bacterium]